MTVDELTLWNRRSKVIPQGRLPLSESIPKIANGNLSFAFSIPPNTHTCALFFTA